VLFFFWGCHWTAQFRESGVCIRVCVIRKSHEQCNITYWHRRTSCMSCAHALERLLLEDLRDILGGDEDELALTLLHIVEPLQHPLSVLQEARRLALTSPSPVASVEMQPLEAADRHPAPSQKLPTSKQPTPPAAPASAPPLSSASIAPSPLSLNLLPYTLNHSLQTGDSNLVANTTIDSSRKEKVPQQQGLDIGRPLSNLVVKVTKSPAISPGHRGFVSKL